MMARQPARRSPTGRVALRNWLPHVLIVAIGLFPFVVIYVATETRWVCKGEQSTIFGRLAGDCEQLLAVTVVLAAVGVLGLLTLPFLWRRSGMMSIFEVPWLGVGDDVDSAGAIESAVRAALFFVFFWLCFGMTVLAVVAMWKGFGPKDSGSATPPTVRSTPTSVDLTPFLTEFKVVKEKLDGINTKLDGLDTVNKKLDGVDAKVADLAKQFAGFDVNQLKLGEWDQGIARTAGILRQTERLNVGLDRIQSELKQHGRQTAMLEEIVRRLDALLPDKEHPSSEAVASILTQTQRLATSVERLSTQITRQEEHLFLLDYVYQVLADRNVASANCFEVDLTAEVAPRIETSDPEARRVPSGTPIGRYRSVAIRPILFDRDSSTLSPFAEQMLRWFLVQVREPASAVVMIHGSTDPQGSKERNDKLGPQRVAAVKAFLVANAPGVRFARLTSHSSGGSPQSEPYKRVTAIWLLEPCQ